MKRTIVVIAMCGASACAPVPTPGGPDVKLTAATAGLVAGKPQQCIDLSDANGAEAFDGGIIYRGHSRITYVNLSPGCRRAGSDDIFINRVTSSPLCRGDIVQFADRNSGIAGGSCVLGDFTPYRKPH